MSPADPVAVSSIEEGGIEFSTRDELFLSHKRKIFFQQGTDVDILNRREIRYPTMKPLSRHAFLSPAQPWELK